MQKEMHHSVLPALLHGLYLGFFPPDVLTLMHINVTFPYCGFETGGCFCDAGLLCLSGGTKETGQLEKEEPTPRASGAA